MTYLEWFEVHANKHKAIHLDCSDCLIPNQKSVIEKYFSRNWREVMKETIILCHLQSRVK